MDLRVRTWGFGQDSSVGGLFLDGRRMCWTLEDEARHRKVAGETRIPRGRYRVTLRTVGGFHARYLKRFGPDFHKGMLWIRDVPGFEYVLIHCGNDDDDTAGCILVGTNFHTHVNSQSVEFTVSESVKAYQLVYPPIAHALEQGEEVWFTVEDAIEVDAA